MSNHYGMFSEFGNDAVDAIVRSARILKMDWPTVENELFSLVERFPKDFPEATDTVVREAVYCTLGFDKCI